MLDISEMLRQYREVDQPRLEAICSSHRECVSKHRNEKVLVMLIAIMLCSTICYMAWNVYEVNRISRVMQNEIDERQSEKSRAAKMVDELLKSRNWSKEIVDK